MNAHADRWLRPITIESEHPGPPREREREWEREGVQERKRRMWCSADPIKKRDEGGRKGRVEGWRKGMCVCVFICGWRGGGERRGGGGP